jgi:hypothetical protein
VSPSSSDKVEDAFGNIPLALGFCRMSCLSFHGVPAIALKFTFRRILAPKFKGRYCDDDQDKYPNSSIHGCPLSFHNLKLSAV